MYYIMKPFHVVNMRNVLIELKISDTFMHRTYLQLTTCKTLLKDESYNKLKKIKEKKK